MVTLAHHSRINPAAAASPAAATGAHATTAAAAEEAAKAAARTHVGQAVADEVAVDVAAAAAGIESNKFLTAV